MANPEHVAKVKAFYEWLGANAPLDLNMADLTAANLKGAYLAACRRERLPVGANLW